LAHLLRIFSNARIRYAVTAINIQP
jgi:hypothetical protein